MLHVERSVKREEEGRALRVGPTKTHQNRRVSLDPVTLAVIDTHRQRAEGWAADARVEPIDRRLESDRVNQLQRSRQAALNALSWQVLSGRQGRPQACRGH